MATKSIKKQNPIDLDNLNWKKLTLVGGGILAAGLTIAWVVKAFDKPAVKKTNYGLTVAPQCSNYTITDELMLKTKLREAVARAGKKDNNDPFTITAAYLTQKGIGCTSYPAVPRNPGEAKLFFDIFTMVTVIMQDTNKLSQQSRNTFDAMAKTWATSHGAFPADEVIIFEDDQIQPDAPPLA
jgi:hypothetical protein